MTLDEELASIEKRANAPNLPAGPWTPCGRDADDPSVTCPDARFGRLLMLFWPSHPAEETPWAEDAIYSAAEFIAAARTDVPRLVAALRLAIEQRDQVLSRSWTQTRKVRNQNRYDAAILCALRGES